MNLSQEELTTIAEAVADAVTAKVYVHNCRCGLTTELLEYHKEDHKFIGETRKGLKLIQKVGIVTTATGIITAVGSALLVGIKVMLMQGGK